MARLVSPVPCLGQELRLHSVVAFVIALLFPLTSAAEEQPLFGLNYEVQEELTSCPNLASFDDRVAARLGYRPFSESGSRSISVYIVQDDELLLGRIEVYDSSGSMLGERELRGDLEECPELVSMLALDVAVIIDPLSLARPQESEPPVPAAPLLPAPPPPTPAAPLPPERHEPDPPPPPEPSRRTTPHLSLMASPVVTAGLAPHATVGGILQIGVRLHRFMIALEGRAEAQVAERTTSNGALIEADLFSAAIAPCAVLPAHITLCGLVVFGGFQGRSENVIDPILVTTFFAAMEARFQATFELGRIVVLGASADFGVALVRTAINVNDHNVWTAPPVYGRLGLQVAFRVL